MQKKTFIQIFLLTLILLISFLVYNVYFKNKNLENSKKKIIPEKQEDSLPKKNIQNNLLYDVKYFSKGNNGEEYTVNSKFSELNKDEPNLILMRGVVAVIKGKDSTPINIKADNALYDKLNYNTEFYDNVIVTYNDHIISSDKMDLMFDKNLATVSNNIIYKNLNTKLEADMIEIDLITKNSKIFMYNKKKKVKVISLN
tara:strand:+ start:1060 stop:1656 length:597 start_codon:yes stop_codon:yes gene_type:complete